MKHFINKNVFRNFIRLKLLQCDFFSIPLFISYTSKIIICSEGR